jgi:hypothetical protein
LIYSVILFALLVAGAALFVFAPMRRPQAAAPEDSREARERLLREKRSALLLLRDLDFDFGTGKMLEADYRSSRAEAEAWAAGILRALDALGEPQALSEAELEEEIRRVRARLRKELGNAVA